MKKALLVLVGISVSVIVMSELVGYFLSLVPVLSIGGTVAYLGLAIADELGRAKAFFIMKKIRQVWGKAKSSVLKYRKASLVVAVVLTLSLLSNGQELVSQVLISVVGMLIAVGTIGLGWKVYTKMARKRNVVLRPLKVILKAFV